MRIEAVKPQFVEYVPKVLEPGVLYVSEKYKTASHLCACGCGEKVVTPLSPADWKLQINGGKVSLYPSIGNWNYACRSHYWIRNNLIVWSTGMSEQQIARVQTRDLADKARYVAIVNKQKDEAAQSRNEGVNSSSSIIGRLWKTLLSWLGF